MNLNLKVAFCTRARTSSEVKISIEAARLACPESKDETHFLPLPLKKKAGNAQLSNSNSLPNRGATHNEHSTDEGHSPETSGHLVLRFWHSLSFHSLLLFIVATSATQPTNLF